MPAEVTERQARQVAESARESDWQQPSFAKELFLGNFRLDLIHPPPEPGDPAQRERGQAFLARWREFLTEHVDPLQIEADARIPDHVLQGIKDIGALGMKIDPEYGGLGLSQVDYNRALGLAFNAHAALAALLSAHQSIGVPQPLKLAGTEEQKRRFLPRCASTAVSAFLLTEPDVGSDPARMAATALPDHDAGGYRLTGTKLWTTNGVIAELLVVMARVPKTDGHRGGISAFVVESFSPGLTVTHRNAFMGIRGIENGVTVFDDVLVPFDHLIGKEGQGLKIALATLNTGRLSLPAANAAAGKLALKWAREFAAERVQWGKPVGQHEAVAAKLAYVAATAFAMEAVSELSSALADRGRTDVRIEAALAKLFNSEKGWQLTDEVIQIRGGRGYETAASLQARGERPIPIEGVLRDLRIHRIFEGSSEIMRLLIAREAVDAHLQAAGDLVDPDATPRDKARAAFDAAGFYARWLPKLVAGEGLNPRAFSEFGDLAPHLRYAERACRKLARVTFYGMARWQAGLERKQVFLGRIVDVGAELYALTATCVSAQQLGTQQAVALAEEFCRHARRRVDALLDAAFDNDDGATYRTAREVLDGQHTWLEAGVLDLTGDLPLIAPPTTHRRSAPVG